MTDNAVPEGRRLSWRVHPAAERRGTGILVFVAILVLSFLAGLWMGGAFWGAFAFVVLFLSLEAFFLPGSFELTERGVVVKKPFSQAERRWDQFRRVIFDADGITLSPFARRSWLETYRALRLRYPSRVAVARGARALARSGVEPMEPTEPTEPTEPMEPTEPTEPTEHAGGGRAEGAGEGVDASGDRVPTPEEIQGFILEMIDREKVVVLGLGDDETRPAT